MLEQSCAVRIQSGVRLERPQDGIQAAQAVAVPVTFSDEKPVIGRQAWVTFASNREGTFTAKGCDTGLGLEICLCQRPSKGQQTTSRGPSRGIMQGDCAVNDE